MGSVNRGEEKGLNIIPKEIQLEFRLFQESCLIPYFLTFQTFSGRQQTLAKSAFITYCTLIFLLKKEVFTRNVLTKAIV